MVCYHKTIPIKWCLLFYVNFKLYFCVLKAHVRYLKYWMRERSWVLGLFRVSGLTSLVTASWSPTGILWSTFFTCSVIWKRKTEVAFKSKLCWFADDNDAQLIILQAMHIPLIVEECGAKFVLGPKVNYFYKKWAIHGPFLFIFGLFQTNNTFFTTNQCEKCSVHPV